MTSYPPWVLSGFVPQKFQSRTIYLASLARVHTTLALSDDPMNPGVPCVRTRDTITTSDSLPWQVSAYISAALTSLFVSPFSAFWNVARDTPLKRKYSSAICQY